MTNLESCRHAGAEVVLRLVHVQSEMKTLCRTSAIRLVRAMFLDMLVRIENVAPAKARQDLFERLGTVDGLTSKFAQQHHF